MKKHLLTNSKNFYKANLHCHSTISDGALSPNELKEIYMAQGYSIIAYTDHDVLIPHGELADENFLPLYGFEMEFNNNPNADFHFDYVKSTHICAIAMDPENTVQPCWNESYVPKCSRDVIGKVKSDDSLPPYLRIPTPEGISDAMKICRDKGFFVTYNHPNWSLDNYNDYVNLSGMHAMEICNWGAYVEGYGDLNNEREYNDMLRSGKRIYCIATDDTHSHHQCCGGFTMLNADTLDYKTITKALLDGNFYASTGPQINNLWVEEGNLHVECSNAKMITFQTAARHSRSARANQNEFINRAEFTLDERQVYFRVTVTDENGRIAHTNAYFLDEILK